MNRSTFATEIIADRTIQQSDCQWIRHLSWRSRFMKMSPELTIDGTVNRLVPGVLIHDNLCIGGCLQRCLEHGHDPLPLNIGKQLTVGICDI